MKKSLFLLLPPLIMAAAANAQSVFAPLNPAYYHLLDRYEIKHREFATHWHTAMRPMERSRIAAFADSLYRLAGEQSASDRFNINYLLTDSWEWAENGESDSKKPVLKYFYRKQNDAYHVSTNDFDLHVSPVLHLQGGASSDLDNTPFINSRGVEVRGMVGRKVGFYTFLAENQARFPGYVRDFAGPTTPPSEGYGKVYGDNGYDFLTARGYVTFSPIKQIAFQLGQDRNFLGYGHRSLFLSDFATSYPFMKITTNVWRMQYTNLFAQMRTRSPLGVAQPLPKKFMSMHHLSLNIGKNFNLGFFESVIFARPLASGGNGFDVEYLNPVIFYRTLEFQMGDNDNVNLGMDFKWNALKGMQLYGQFLIDDLNVSEFGTGWFGNKTAWQLGLKYVDVAGIANLDLQLEGNRVRPYVHTHFGEPEYANYQHYGQALSHPLGANFQEVVGILRYQPIPRLMLMGKGIYATQGKDGPGQNWGSNIFLDYSTRQQDFDNELGQGLASKLYFLDFTASYQVRHNIFLDFTQVIRRTSLEGTDPVQVSVTSLGLRWNMPGRVHDF